MAEEKTSAITTGNCVEFTVTKQVKGTILGKTIIGTTVAEPEFTSGSGTDNKSVITNKPNEVT